VVYHHVIPGIARTKSSILIYFIVYCAKMRACLGSVYVNAAVFLICLIICAVHAQEKKKFNLVVVSTFKNEKLIQQEWMQHYINEGVEHFYLLDNGSQDDYMTGLQRFPAEMYTLVRDSSPPKTALQDFLMNKYFVSLVKSDAKWVMVVDVDEYIYPTNQSSCISSVLDDMPPNIGRVWVPWKIFGSNKHKTQPKSGVVSSFTKRAPMYTSLDRFALRYGKLIARVTPQLHLLTHHSVNGNRNVYFPDQRLIEFGDHRENHTITEATIVTHPLQLNHYMFQSKYYYETVKCSRGGGQSGRGSKYTMAFYNAHEPLANKLEDTELKSRVKNYLKQRRSCSIMDRATFVVSNK
jgi:hypothetical protein